MKTIPLTQGYSVKVDDEDYEKFSKFSWFVLKRKGDVYARRNSVPVEGKRKTILLHREILSLEDPEKEIDHIDRDTLNCQKSNMRICSRTENVRNTRSRKNSSSKYIGVHHYKKIGKWTAYIRVNKILIHLGRFDNEESAAKVRDEAAKKYHGEFASLNFK